MNIAALLIPIALYVIFMGAPFLRAFETYLDYDKAILRSTTWYVVGILIGGFFLFQFDVSVASLLYLMLAFIIVWFPTLRFAEWWQVHGRPLMPVSGIGQRITTFYDFTPRYSFVKLLEIMFQDLCAILFILMINQMLGDPLMTTLAFSGAFLCIHILALRYFDKFWTWLIFGSVFLTLAVVPSVLYFELGYSLLFVAHTLSYISFLLILQGHKAKNKTAIQ